MKRRRASRATTVQDFARTRPRPPAHLAEIPLADSDERFVPAPDVLAWIRETFIESIHGSPLHNEEHLHLAVAQLGVLWTNVANNRRGRSVIGTAEILCPRGDAWGRARQECQVREWFGLIPDFIITLSAPYAAHASDAEWCALVEHELYHCGQARDDFGSPRFNRETGFPIWTIRGHDVEEFVGVVRRYGADAAGVRSLVEAAAQRPLISDGAIAGACGTCLARAA